MPRLICPECDVEFRLKELPRPGKKARCPECEHAFVPQDDDAEEPAPKKNKTGAKKKKTKKKGAPILLFVLLGGGALFVVLVIAAAGVLFFVFGRGGGAVVANKDAAKRDGAKVEGGGGGLFGKSPTITKASFDQLKLGMTNKEIDAVLGAPGKLVSNKEAINFVLQYDRFDGPPQAPLSFDPSAKYVLYVNGQQQLLAGFVSSKKYGEICAGIDWWDPVNRSANGRHGDRTTSEQARDEFLRGKK